LFGTQCILWSEDYAGLYNNLRYTLHNRNDLHNFCSATRCIVLPMPSYGVCPSVVCPSRSCMASKQVNVFSKFFAVW